MCRLLAMTSNCKTDLLFSTNKLFKIAKERSHKDGWGIAWLNEHNCFELHKGSKPIWESRAARQIIRNVQSNLIVVHARKSEKNDATRKRSHPFKHVALDREWIFAHNGGIDCSAPRRHRVRSDVDSERFFCCLLDSMESIKTGESQDEKKLVTAALEDTLKVTKVRTALNFILASRRNLFAFRYYRRDPDYYNIVYLTRSWKDEKELSKGPGECATILSSEPLSKEKWNPLGNTYMMVVPVGAPKNLKVLSVNV